MESFEDGDFYVISRSYANVDEIEWFENVLTACNYEPDIYETPAMALSRWDDGRKMYKMRHWVFKKNAKWNRPGPHKLERMLHHKGTAAWFGLTKRQFDALLEGFWHADRLPFEHNRIKGANPKETCGIF